MSDYTDFLFNSTLNRTYPNQQLPKLPDKDARDYALEALRKYLAALIFRRTNAEGLDSIPFQLPLDSILLYQPDSPKEAPLPGIGIIPGLGVHNSFGLGPPGLLDDTFGIAGPNTALQHISDYIEPITLEVWGSKKSERRALMAGLKAALRANDSSYAIYLKLPEYYDMQASFFLESSEYIDGDETARNRRRAHLNLTMTVCEVAVVNVRMMNASIETTVLDASAHLKLDC